MNTACGCLNILSHCVQASIIFPLASTTTRQCSQRPSTPYFPFQFASEPSGPGGLETGPWPTFLNGNPLIGNDRLGPNCGNGSTAGRLSTGTSPRWKI